MSQAPRRLVACVLAASLLGALVGLVGSTTVYGYSTTRVPALEATTVPRMALAARPVAPTPAAINVPAREFQEIADPSPVTPGLLSVRSLWAAVGATTLVAMGVLLRWTRPTASYDEIPDIEFGGEYTAEDLGAGMPMPNLVSRVLGPLNPFRARDLALGAKRKGIRLIVTLECTEARGLGETPSRYTTEKNKKNTSARLELRKYNKYLRRHTLHREIK